MKGAEGGGEVRPPKGIYRWVRGLPCSSFPPALGRGGVGWTKSVQEDRGLRCDLCGGVMPGDSKDVIGGK